MSTKTELLLLSDEELQKKFDDAVKTVKDGPADPSHTNSTKLLMYGLYKQATVGDNNEKAPWAVKVVARAKWEAWNEQKGKSKNEAMAEYVENVLKRMDV